MWMFIKRWHPLLAIAIGIYLAIPKPEPFEAEIDEKFLEEYDKNDDGVVDRDEFPGPDFDLRDEDRNNVLTLGSRWKWPLYQYRWNLGQDLKGGSSLRYRLVQQDLADAERQIRELLRPLQEAGDRLPAAAREAFGDVIDGRELRVGEWKDEDFELLRVPAVFDEGHADALRRYYGYWSDAKTRQIDQDLVGPTIETLNRRLGTIGITELNIAPLGEERLEVKLPQFASSAETDRYKRLLETTGKLDMRVLASEDGEFRNLNAPEKPRGEGYKYEWKELARDDATQSQLVKEHNGRKWVPVQVIDDYNISGKDLTNIQPTTDQQGRMAVSFDLKGLAVARFENLTRVHKVAAKGGADPRLLAILIDDKVYSAYTIQDTISGSVQLSGNFDSKERDDIINVLKSGSLNVKLELEGEESVGPSEGAESVRRGIVSFGIAAVFVLLFALWLYRGIGMLVMFNLFTIVVLIMGAMSVGMGTLTLPGIAGLVLTFGMAIDGNILINERIREELQRGSSLRNAAEEGFNNAFSAILDSNITTLLTALILYKVGSGPVQGFALTVAIGIVATLYANILAYKSMLMGLLNIKRDLRFSMASMKWLENRNIDFVRGMRVAVPVAVILSIAGIAMLFNLGSSVLGMEFRGGHVFRVQMNKGYERDQIASVLLNEDTLEPKFDWAAGVEVQPVFRLGGGPEGGGADRFDFRFAMRDEWVDRTPEELTNYLQGELQKEYAEYMVRDGWSARPANLREMAMEATFTHALRDAAAFREAWAEDFDALWVSRDRQWGNDPSAARTRKDQWFGEVSPADLLVTAALNASRDRQTVTVRATGVAVANEEDRRRKFESFKSAVQRYFWADSETVTLEGEPKYSEVPIKASIVVDVVFLEPVNVQEFTQFVQDIPGGRISALAGTTLTATAVRSDAEASAADTEGDTALAFEIRSGEFTFSPEPVDPNHFSHIEGELNKSITDWLNNNSEGNEISKRFVLSSAIGAVVAEEMQWRALLAILAALVVICIYMRIRFASLAWGIAAIVAMTFVVTVTLAALGIADTLGADMKIDLVIVAALLTVIGYAVNDTIVNFDRIRETLKKDRLETGGTTPFKDIINQSVNLMLPRTMLTSTTTLTSTFIMMFLGGPLLAAFSFTISMGVIAGTFASVFIAAPVLLLFERRGTGDLLDLTEEEIKEEGLAAAPAPEQAKEEPEPGEDSKGEKGEEKQK